jgi:hypothetical protein
MPFAILTLSWCAAAATHPGLAVIQKRCAGCHSGSGRKSGLDVTSHKMLMRGGDRGPAVVPGNARESLLYRVTAREAEPHMPFGMPAIPVEELSAIAQWIDEGAAYGEAVTAAAPAATTHWAYQPVQRPAVPGGKDGNPVDAFLAAARSARGLTTAAEAGRRTLARRLYLDVIGVPPAVEEMRAFAADSSPDAYEKLVDKLLADPRYGERWGRHWMDIWRYSDWYGWRRGNDVRNSVKFIWRWRDWIVESLNQDKGYDQMVREMVAGDEIAPGDPQVLRATGYLARSFSKYDRHGWMQNAVDHTAMAFLGLTLKCARCHDHKYDPLSQAEYYQFRAFFEPYHVRTDRIPGQADTEKDGLARVYDQEPNAVTQLLIRGDIQNPDADMKIEPGTPRALGGAPLRIRPVALSVEQYYPDFREFVHKDLLEQARGEIEKARQAVSEAKEGEDRTIAEKALAAATAYLPALEARIAADKAHYSRPPLPNAEELAAAARKAEREAGILKASENLLRAQKEFSAAMAAQPADEKKIAAAQKQLQAAVKALEQPPGGQYTPAGKPYPEKSSGRRLALAQWMTDRDNPLTARVAVNHIWLRHFGEGIVSTPADFGASGKPPSHPELLDWLAAELMSRNWSMKHVHRPLLTSKAYRMRSSSAGLEGNAKIDSENRYLWRMNPRRMEAEAVRDSILAVAGTLDGTRGGAPVDGTQALKSRRRTIYLEHTPDIPIPFLKIFDAANPAECYRRDETVVPHQALALANSELSREQARLLAQRLYDAGQGDDRFVAAAFETVLGRPPSDAEQQSARRFVRNGQDREDLVHVLFNHNDFVTIH